MRHTAAGHGGHRSMVRTAVCGAADEGSIPSGHPTRPRGHPLDRRLELTRFLSDFSYSSQVAPTEPTHSGVHRQTT
jgi:hypothetical protein